VAAHRWRLALPVNPLPEKFLFDASQAIGLAGDWCGGPRVEGAYLSGLALAQAIAS
jgi:renalase